MWGWHIKHNSSYPWPVTIILFYALTAAASGPKEEGCYAKSPSGTVLLYFEVYTILWRHFHWNASLMQFVVEFEFLYVWVGFFALPNHPPSTPSLYTPPPRHPPSPSTPLVVVRCQWGLLVLSSLWTVAWFAVWLLLGLCLFCDQESLCTCSNEICQCVCVGREREIELWLERSKTIRRGERERERGIDWFNFN